MKRYCKNIDITDSNLIKKAIISCLENRYKRNDVRKLLAESNNLSFNDFVEIQNKLPKSEVLSLYTKNISKTLQKEIMNDSITFSDIQYEQRIDSSSGKLRRIGVQDIKQQMYDYIAVEGLSPFLVRIGEYQCASIKGRGQIYGMKAVRRWLRNKSMRYIGQLDVKKCYESIDREKLLCFFTKTYKE